jgi:hypothetical protein
VGLDQMDKTLSQKCTALLLIFIIFNKKGERIPSSGSHVIVLKDVMVTGKDQ